MEAEPRQALSEFRSTLEVGTADAVLATARRATQLAHDAPRIAHRIHHAIAEKDPDNAITFSLWAYNQGIRSEPGNNCLVVLLSQRRRHKEAIEIVDALLASDPNNATYLHAAGFAYSASGDEERALQNYVKCKDQNPDKVSAWEDIFISLRTLKRGGDSQPFIDELLQRMPNNMAAVSEAAQQLALTDRSKARSILTPFAAKLEESTDSDALIRFSQACRRCGMYDLALTAINRAEQYGADTEQCSLARGDIYYRSQRYQNAVDEFRSALSQSPEDAHLKSHLGTALHRLGDLDAALSVFLTIPHADSTHGTAMANLSSIYQELGRHDEALETAATAIAEDLHPIHFFWYSKAISLAALHRFDDARLAFAHAASAYAVDGAFHFARGYTLARVGAFIESIDSFEKARITGADEPQTSYNLGVAYLSNKEAEKGLSAFRSILVHAPDNRGAAVGELYCLESLERYTELRARAFELLDRNDPPPAAFLTSSRAAFELAARGQDELLIDDCVELASKGLLAATALSLGKERSELELELYEIRAHANATRNRIRDARSDLQRCVEIAGSLGRPVSQRQLNLRRLSGARTLASLPAWLTYVLAIVDLAILGSIIWLAPGLQLSGAPLATCITALGLALPAIFILPLVNRFKFAGIELERSTLISPATLKLERPRTSIDSEAHGLKLHEARTTASYYGFVHSPSDERPPVKFID